MNKKIEISIIIPVLNAKDDLDLTLKSIRKQNYQEFECLIIDGGSNDGTMDLVKKYDFIDKVVSEKDKGIYDAINKGIGFSTGNIISTINSGDEYFSENSLSIVIKKFNENNIDFLFGAVKKNKVYYKYEPKKMNWSFNFYPAHSGGFFVKKKVHNKIGLYSLKYPCSADYDFFWKMIKKHNYKGMSTNINEVISIFKSGGFSSKYSFFEHVMEETKIRYNNGQNKLFVIFLLVARCIRHWKKFLN